MKRSAQIGLLVMGALTTTSAAGYFATNHDRSCRERAQNNPGTPAQDCRRSVWYGSGHSSGGARPLFAGGSPSGGAAAPATPSAATTAVPRGGFGGFASHIVHAFSGS